MRRLDKASEVSDKFKKQRERLESKNKILREGLKSIADCGEKKFNPHCRGCYAMKTLIEADKIEGGHI